MRGVLRYLLIAIVAVVTISLTTGCARKQTPKQKFQVVSVDNLSGSISEGWRITLTIANNTASNLRITNASAFVRHNGRRIGRITLNGEILIPRRRCSQVVVPLRVTLANPIAALGVFNKVRKGDFSGVTVDYNVSVAALTSHRIFEQEGVSLEKLAQQFNFGLKK